MDCSSSAVQENNDTDVQQHKVTQMTVITCHPPAKGPGAGPNWILMDVNRDGDKWTEVRPGPTGGGAQLWGGSILFTISRRQKQRKWDGASR